MYKRVSTFAIVLAGATALATSAIAQDQTDDQTPAPAQEVQTPADASFDEAFPRMVSEPLVQGDLAPPGPLVEAWGLDQVSAMIEVIEGIGAEGLDPDDYDHAALKQLLTQGPSEALDKLASKNFVWLVEDLRDGRTPMDARVQWFVVDPDRDRFRSRELLSTALTTGDIAGTLAELNPTHPDYAALRAELAATPLEETAKRKLIRANMDRWRWLARDLGKQYLITNVPEYQLRLTVADKIISTYRTVVGKPLAFHNRLGDGPGWVEN
ncbi:MAG: L,D-transpeptidase, partial [Pseudomonadota bacterium]